MKKVTVMKLILITLLSFSLTSCMMMMPAHMSDMDHSNNASSDARIDKVCGKTVGPESSFTYEYKGTNYYFDSEQCLTVFKNNPDHFLQKSTDDAHAKNMKTTMWIGGAIVMTAMMVFMMISVF
jgi:YHS domain-containing protein